MTIELYDQEEVLRSYVESELYDNKIETAKRLLKMGKLSVEEVAIGTDLTVEEIEKLADMLLT